MFDEERLAIQEASEHEIANLQFCQFILIAFVSIMILFLIVIVANKIIKAKTIADDRNQYASPPDLLSVSKSGEWVFTKASKRKNWWKIFWGEF